jgi:V/A-type H+/Na+-transporting ATPase subunit I
MISSERMRKLEVLVLARDVDAVLRYLGFAGCLQLIAERSQPRDLTADERGIADLNNKFASLCRFLGVEAAEPGAGPQPAPDREQLVSRAQQLMDDAQNLVDEEARLLALKLSLKQTVDELEAFAHLRVAFSELEHLTYLAFRLGTVPVEKVASLTAALEKRALVVPLGRPGFIMAIASKKGRWALDSEMRAAGFQETKFPTDLKGVPAEVLPAVQASLAQTESALVDIAGRKAEFRDQRRGELASIAGHLALDVSIDTVKQGLPATGSVLKVTGWVPRRRFTETVEGLSSITGGRIAIRAWEPEEVPEIRSGKAKVPVALRHGRFTRSFERMVFSYGVPLYGTIDPTPFVAVVFVLLFAIMFGDVGQGFVALAIGLAISSGRFKGLERFRQKHFGGIFTAVGIASMVTGIIYGSFFANEVILEPVTRWLSTLIFGRPVDHFVTITGSGRILTFFGFTIAVGAVINSVGLAINIVNQLRLRNWEKAFFSKTGLAGALFFWYALSLAVRLVLGGRIGGLDFVALALPLLAIFFREPLVHLIFGHRPILKEGMLSFLMEGIVEILESLTYYVSNSVSFLRVAAFAMAHAVLSVIVFELGDMVAAAPGGMVFKVLIVLIGNLIIIVLEGLIVTIQVVRLQYYEFFSKFFTETGEAFKPFTLNPKGGSP